MNMNKLDTKSAINDAANEAVFWYQLNTPSAIRFITKSVKGVSREDAAKAVKESVVSYKARA